MDLSPGSAPALDTLAGVAEAHGDCPVALQIQRRAMELLPEGLADAGRAAYRERLARLEKACGAAAAAPPAPASAAK